MNASRATSEFELVRRSLLQADGLPFADVLTAEQMQRAFDDEGVAFDETDGRPGDETGLVYTPAIVRWAMLSQMLFTTAQRSCRAAVVRVAAHDALTGRLCDKHRGLLASLREAHRRSCPAAGAERGDWLRSASPRRVAVVGAHGATRGWHHVLDA